MKSSCEHAFVRLSADHVLAYSTIFIYTNETRLYIRRSAFAEHHYLAVSTRKNISSLMVIELHLEPQIVSSSNKEYPRKKWLKKAPTEINISVFYFVLFFLLSRDIFPSQPSLIPGANKSAYSDDEASALHDDGPPCSRSRTSLIEARALHSGSPQISSPNGRRCSGGIDRRRAARKQPPLPVELVAAKLATRQR